MKRTKQPGVAKNATKKPATKKTTPKKPSTTKDGRVLGTKTVDLVPKNVQNIIHKESKDTQKRSPRETQKRAQTRHLVDMTRNRMPLAFTEDGEVEYKQKKFVLRGLNQAKFNAVYAGLSIGMTKQRACDLAGIHASTLNTWIAKGKEGYESGDKSNPYAVIYVAIKEAEATLERELMEAVQRAAKDSILYKEVVDEKKEDRFGKSKSTKTATRVRTPQWQAAAWLLERKFADWRMPTIAPNKEQDGQQQLQEQDDDILTMNAVTLGLVMNGGSDE